MSCLELVGDGKLNADDALETMKEWGLNDVDGVADRIQSEENVEDLLEAGPFGDISGNNPAELGMMMNLLGALGLQLPAEQKGEVPEEGDVDSQLGGMLQMLAPVQEGSLKNETGEPDELNFEEILAILEESDGSTGKPAGEQKVKETAPEDDSNTMGWLFRNDPTAAKGILAPLLEAIRLSGIPSTDRDVIDVESITTQPEKETNNTRLDTAGDIDKEDWVLVDATVPEDEWAADVDEEEVVS
jgi:hypothetical protein